MISIIEKTQSSPIQNYLLPSLSWIIASYWNVKITNNIVWQRESLKQQIFTIASFSGTWKIRGSAWYTLFVHARSLLGNLHTIRYTNNALTNSPFQPVDKPYCRVMLSVKYIRQLLVYHLVQGDRWTLQAKSWVFSLLPRHCFNEAWSYGRHLLHQRNQPTNQG